MARWPAGSKSHVMSKPRPQLNLFTDQFCDYCGAGEPSPRNPLLWNGFKDGDTGHKVCWNCRNKHYAQKQQATYTETLVYNFSNHTRR